MTADALYRPDLSLKGKLRRRVVRLRDGFHSQKQFDHFLHLMFFGVTVADHRLFNQARAVFGDFKLMLFSDHQHHPAHLP